MKTWLVACATALMSCAQIYAQTPYEDAVTAQLGTWHESGQFSGTIRVERPEDGQVYQSAGLADDAAGRPVSEATPFYIASTAKAFTAVMVLQQVEAGLIELDAPIGPYFPEIDAETGQGVSIRHLLSHTAGLPREYAEALDDKVEYTLADVFRSINLTGLMFEPGSRESYSNTGYILLAELLQRVTGQAYGDLLHARILRPAGMSATGTQRPSNAATGYTAPDALSRIAVPLAERTEPPLLGAGGVYSTTGDLFAFQTALVEGRLLREAMLHILLSPVALNEGSGSGGMGFEFYPVSDGGRIIAASGAGEGSLSFLAWLDSEPDRRMVSLVNDMRLGRNGSFPFYIGLLQIMLGENEGTAPVPTPMADFLGALMNEGEDAARALHAGLDWSRPPVANAAASQATGAPNGGVGETMYAWAPASADAGAEWLQLGWQTPVEARAVHVHFTQIPGVITGLEVNAGGAEPVEGADRQTTSEAGAPVETYLLDHDLPIERLRLLMDTQSQPGWPQIDAVGLEDEAGDIHWASTATASTSAFMSGDVSIHDLPTPDNLAKLALRLEETGHDTLAADIARLAQTLELPGGAEE